MGDILKVKLGTCKVTFKGVDIGHTIGGVEVSYNPEFKRTKVDQYAGPAEEWLVGEELTAKVPLAESSLANLQMALTHATLVAAKALSIGSYAGKRSSTKAGLLILHPLANATNDKSDDVAIYKAVSIKESVLPFKNDGEKIIETTFSGIVDEGRTDGNLLGFIGDSL